MKIARIIFIVSFIVLFVIIIDGLPFDKNQETVSDVKEENVLNKQSTPANAKNTNTDSKTLEQKLDNYIKNEPLLNGGIIGISIRSTATGDLIYQHNGNTRLHPASNMKLFTAAAALSTLGRDHTFSTEILTSGTTKGNILHGNLYLKGKGDPTLLLEDFAMFAKKIKESGIKRIHGNIIGDDTWYDDVRISPDLIWDDEQYYYGAQISALTASPTSDYDAGSVVVEVVPGSYEGEKPSVSISPNTDYVQVKNTATTVAAGQEGNLEIGRKHGTNIITIKGSIPSDSETSKEWIAVWEPTGYALDLFQQALKRQGISWSGEVKVGKTPEEANLLVSHESMPLSDLLMPFMKLSNNVIGEILVKEMGKVVKGEGSWEKGLEVMEEELLKLGLDIETMKIRDGSGISSINLIPPNQISKLLYAVQSKDWYSTFIHSLPVAGIKERMIGGTLRNRMSELSGIARIQAKTGTIHSVSSLSGYINTKESESVIFSIVSNHLIDEDDGKEIEDKIVSILANSQ